MTELSIEDESFQWTVDEIARRIAADHPQVTGQYRCFVFIDGIEYTTRSNHS